MTRSDAQPQRDPTQLADLEERLGVSFRRIDLLRHALRHRSASLAPNEPSNERLEFLGDAIIGMVVSHELFRSDPSLSEGGLAKSKSFVVSKPALAAAARQLGLSAFVQMSATDAAAGGCERDSVLADTFEAVIAAVYLDRGITAARRTIRLWLGAAMDGALAGGIGCDYKSALQEMVQARLRHAPVYRTSPSGVVHKQVFDAEVLVNHCMVGAGTGSSKRAAQQAAARAALSRIEADGWPEGVVDVEPQASSANGERGTPPGALPVVQEDAVDA
ncbi:MAG: ribonuclease III [Armatimonadetes bacterium]|nr:ribonuclease III [Armatimonadota bacterium]MDE2205890.1 ribonuclease III [Armatimonadota bacterium]